MFVGPQDAVAAAGDQAGAPYGPIRTRKNNPTPDESTLKQPVAIYRIRFRSVINKAVAGLSLNPTDDAKKIEDAGGILPTP